MPRSRPVPRGASRDARNGRGGAEIAHPRVSIWHVAGRVRMRLLEIQVWDVGATMSFYLLLSVLPAAIAVVSVVSLLGFEDRTVETVGELITEIFPTVDPYPYASALLALARTGGGVPGILLGTAGAVLSASNGVAAFHRALHRVYDTREGRPFLRFRAIVVGETVVLLSMAMLATAVIAVGGEWSQRLGDLAGVDRAAFALWNLVKWPLLLVMITLAVSLSYYLFPNIRLPRYRVMSLGSIISVLVLFALALVAGRLASLLTRVSDLLPAINGAIAVLLLVWLACMVIIGGAALDAEFLRARQIALGLPAWERILVEPQERHSLDFFESARQRSMELERPVAEAARDGRALPRRRGLHVVDASSPLAVDPSARSARAILAATADEPRMIDEQPTVDSTRTTDDPTTRRGDDV